MPDTTPQIPRRRRGWPILAWIVILVVVGVILVRQQQRRFPPITDAVSSQMQGRYYVGSASFNLPGSESAEIYEQAKNAFADGDYSQRLRLAILAGELVSLKEAKTQLDALEKDRLEGNIDARPVSVEVVELLQKLYAGYRKKGVERPVLDDEEQQTLRRRLRWYGDLALAPEFTADTEGRKQVIAAARRTVLGFFAIGTGVTIGLGVGSLLLFAVITWWSWNRLQSQLRLENGNGGVYVEAFALYMAVFVGLNMGVWYLVRNRYLSFSGYREFIPPSIMLISLTAIFWPMIRGVSWGEMRRDLGLNRGQGFLREMMLGIGTYFTAIPVLGIGFLLMLGLMYLAKNLNLVDDPFRGGGPTHPIIGVALSRNWWPWIQVFLLACVGAPILEEIMFRGLLYQHLREATGDFWPTASVAISVVVSSFLFAVIHPQGWFGVPVLMSLAATFALSRELRGSLIAPMVAHAINNGTIMAVLLVVAG